MSRMESLRPDGTRFDKFLYAELGEDDAGNAVSVLSALSRLGLDPWDEAAALSTLPRDGAVTRLGGLLARVRDVPELASGQAAILPRLIGLLPRHEPRPDRPSLPGAAIARMGGIGPVLVLVLAIMILVRIYMSGSLGFGG